MEDWLDFDYRQMPEVQPQMYGQIPVTPWYQGQMMPYQQMHMPYQQVPIQAPLQTPPAPGIQMPTVEGTGTGAPDFEMEAGAPVQQNKNYLQGYLRTQIGNTVRLEFLIGTNMLTDRTGTLVEVGIDHVTLIPFNSSDLIVADIYSVKFVTVYGGAAQYNQTLAAGDSITR